MTHSKAEAISPPQAENKRQRDWNTTLGWILTIIAVGYGIGAVFGALLHSWLLSLCVFLIFHSILLVVGIVAWLSVFFILFYYSRRKIIIVYQFIVATFLLSGGTLWQIGLVYEPVYSKWQNGVSYHLMFMTDFTDVAHYDVLKCDILGIRCERMFLSENYYNRDHWTPRKDARLVWNEDQHTLAFSLNNETLFTENAE